MLVQHASQLSQDMRPARPGSHSASSGVAVARTQPAPQQAAQQTAPQHNTAQPDITEQLKKAVEQSNNALKFNNTNLQFSVDKDTNTTVIKLMDSETGELIRQIPSKEMLEIARSISQVQQGLLLRQKA